MALTPFVKPVETEESVISNWGSTRLINYGIDRLFRLQPHVRTVVHFIARQIASLPVHVYKTEADGSKTKDETSVLASILKSPTPASDGTSYNLLYSLVADMLLYDRFCLAYTVFRQPKRSTGLRRVPPQVFDFLTNGWNEISRIRVLAPDGSSANYDPSLFAFYRGYSETENGSPTLEALRDLLREFDESVSYRRSVYQNSAIVPMYIERPKDKPWSEEARKRFAESWKNYRPSAGKAGGTPILEDGMQVKTLPMHNPLEVNDLAQRQLTLVEVCNIFQIAPELVGAREGNFASIDALQNSLFNVSLGPYIILLEQALTQSLPRLTGLDDSYYVSFNINAKLRGSFNEQMQAYVRMAGRPFYTVNEVRALENRAPIEGGDELATPLNVALGDVPNAMDTGGGRPAGT